MKYIIELDEEVFDEIVSADDDSHLSRAFLNGSYLYFKEALQSATPNPKENVLDKIRKEVTELVKTYPFVNHFDTYVKEDEVLAIIDKYKDKGIEE